jgi:aspartyl-tRNA(Asn)/glutamyl-tRNA(Gln) amidotransferase subunit C
MKLDLDEARRVAGLASLEFDATDLARMADEMSRILDYVDQLREVDVSAVAESVAEVESASRSDEPSESGVAGAVEGNAPSMLRGHFAVPKVIGAD